MKTLATIALAVGLGLAWTGPAIAQESKTGEVKEKAKDAGESAKDKMKSTGEKIKDKAVEWKDKAKEKMSGGNDRTNPADVKAAQRALAAKGYDPGRADGVIGPRTRAAVKDFQQKEGLKVTGRLDADTMARLGAGAAASPRTDTGTPVPQAARPKR